MTQVDAIYAIPYYKSQLRIEIYKTISNKNYP